MASTKTRATTRCDATLIGAVASIGVVLLARLHFIPHAPGDTVAVVFPPWTPNGPAIATAVAAGASIVRLGRFQFIAVVHPNNPHYADRVIAKGAWLVLDPGVLGGCLTHGSLQS